jgi:hypothetical protein
MGGETRTAEYSDAELGRIAGELRQIARGSSWSRTLATGELVLRHFFAGRVEEWRTHRRQKEASIRRLAQRADCPLGKSALSEAVAIHVAQKELPAFVRELTPSHVGLALRLPTVQRLELLRKAHTSGWSVRAMRVEVLALKRRAGERRGRPRFSPIQAALAHATKSLDELRESAALLSSAPDPVHEDALHALARTFDDVAHDLVTARARLGALGWSDGANVRGVVKTGVVAKRPASRTG